MPEWLTLTLTVDQTTNLDIPGGWATVIAALITFLIGPAVIAILGARLTRKVNHLSADTKATRHQVENSHSTNLRDDQDDKHAELVELVKAVIGAQKSQGAEIGGVREELRGVRRDVSDLRGELGVERERIRDLEDTRPHAQTRSRRPQN